MSSGTDQSESGSGSGDDSSTSSRRPIPANETAAELLGRIQARGSHSMQRQHERGDFPPASSGGGGAEGASDPPSHSAKFMKEELEAARKEIATQDQIIETLQKDNEALHTSAKQLQTHAKELESKLMNLEAKHSLLQSANEGTNIDTSGEIRKLSTKNKELQQALEEAEINALSLKAEIRKLRGEVGRIASLEADLHASRVDQKRKDLQHKEVLARLEAKLMEVSGRENEGKHNSNPDTSVASIDHVEIQKLDRNGNDEKVRDLEAKVKELQHTLEEQRKSNIKELVDAVQLSEPQRESKKLSARLEQLEAALREKDSCMERMVERLRTETDTIRKSYEEKIRQLESKIIQLQHELTRAKTGGTSASKSPAKENHDHASGDCRCVPSTQEKQVRFVDEREHTRDREEGSTRDRLSILESEVEGYRRLAHESQALLRRSNEMWEEQSNAFKEDFLQQLRSLRQRHNADIDRLQQYHKEELGQVLAELTTIKEGSSTFTGPLCVPPDESYSTEKGRAFLESVAVRLSQLEKHCQQRENAAAFELSEAKRAALAERRLLSEKYEMLLAQKNNQIDQFRTELDDMIASMASLRYVSRS